MQLLKQLFLNASITHIFQWKIKHKRFWNDVNLCHTSSQVGDRQPKQVNLKSKPCHYAFFVKNRIDFLIIYTPHWNDLGGIFQSYPVGKQIQSIYQKPIVLEMAWNKSLFASAAAVSHISNLLEKKITKKNSFGAC